MVRRTASFMVAVLMFCHSSIFRYESEVQGENVLKFVIAAFEKIGKKRSTNSTPSKIYPLMLWGKVNIFVHNTIIIIPNSKKLTYVCMCRKGCLFTWLLVFYSDC